VYENLPAKPNKSTIIQDLFDYCIRKDNIDNLVRNIKKFNSKVVNTYNSHLISKIESQMLLLCEEWYNTLSPFDKLDPKTCIAKDDGKDDGKFDPRLPFRIGPYKYYPPRGTPIITQDMLLIRRLIPGSRLVEPMEQQLISLINKMREIESL
jgi:hypothetical protein